MRALSLGRGNNMRGAGRRQTDRHIETERERDYYYNEPSS